MAKILIPLAQGFEEIEAVTNIDVLRRAGVEVLTAGIGSKQITGDHKIKIEADMEISDVEAADLDGIVVPGGMPGAANLRNSSQLLEIIREIDEKDGLCAAICAGPIVFEAAGIIAGKNVTSFPGFGDQLDSANHKKDRVVIDSNIITGKGPGAALEFALSLVEYLFDQDERKELEKSMIVKKD